MCVVVRRLPQRQNGAPTLRSPTYSGQHMGLAPFVVSRLGGTLEPWNLGGTLIERSADDHYMMSQRWVAMDLQNRSLRLSWLNHQFFSNQFPRLIILTQLPCIWLMILWHFVQVDGSQPSDDLWPQSGKTLVFYVVVQLQATLRLACQWTRIDIWDELKGSPVMPHVKLWWASSW